MPLFTLLTAFDLRAPTLIIIIIIIIVGVKKKNENFINRNLNEFLAFVSRKLIVVLHYQVKTLVVFWYKCGLNLNLLFNAKRLYWTLPAKLT